MGAETIGIVLVEAVIENLFDVNSAEYGLIPASQVRRIEIPDARVDTGAKYVTMLRRLIDQLGLKRVKIIHARTVAGMAPLGIDSSVKLTIQGRDCDVRVAEVADNCAPYWSASSRSNDSILSSTLAIRSESATPTMAASS
jgi:hypothetical protein